MKAVIMAGGRGTRIASLAPEIPKPMIRIGDKPVLEHEVECLRDQGISEIIITVNYRADVIMDYFKDGSGISPATRKPFGVHITYYVEETPLGNAGALFEIKDQLSEDFLLLNADSIFNVDFNRFISNHRRNHGLATLFTHPNTHPYDSGLIIADKHGSVTQWLTKEDVRPEYYHNRVNAGLHILSPKLLEKRPEIQKVDLDRHILKPLAGTGQLYCYDSPEYVRDMGTPERYAVVCEDYQKGIIAAKNLRNRQKAIFLDRDGTINRYVGFLRDIDEFELLPGTAEAVRKINSSDYLAIVITNQPVLARGEITFDQLNCIHDKMETLLAKEGAYLDAIYFCPHHPDRGYEGEVPELKVDCDCRKPKPGMLLKAAEDFNIDLFQSWMIGDGEIDIKAGIAAGTRTALLNDANKCFGQDISGSELQVLIGEIMSKECSE